MMRLFGLIAALALVAGIAGACAEPRATDPLERGRQIYREKSCGSCHQIGTAGGGSGPALTYIGTVGQTRAAGTGAEEYIVAAIRDPGAYIVPGYPDTMPRGLDRGMTQEDFDDLVQYLLGLR